MRALALRAGTLTSHLWFEISSLAGGMLGLGTLCVFIIVGTRRQARRYEAEKSVHARSSLRVVEPTSQAALKAPTTPRRRRKGELELLPPSSTVNFADERKAADIDGVLDALERDLVGLYPVKRKVAEIASLLLVDRARNKFGLTAPRPNLHMCFTGPPGTGKTTMALRMAELLYRLGYLEKGQLVHAMRDDLVGEFVGHTAPKTRRVL